MRTSQQKYEAARAKAIRLATETGDPHAVTRTRSGAFQVRMILNIPDAVPLLFLTVTPENWNRGTRE